MAVGYPLVSSTFAGRVSPTTAKSKEDTEPPVGPMVPTGGAPLPPLLLLLDPPLLPLLPLELPPLLPMPPLPPLLLERVPLLLPLPPLLEAPPQTPPRGTHALTDCPLVVFSDVHAWSEGHETPVEHAAAQYVSPANCAQRAPPQSALLRHGLQAAPTALASAAEPASPSQAFWALLEQAARYAPDARSTATPTRRVERPTTIMGYCLRVRHVPATHQRNSFTSPTVTT